VSSTALRRAVEDLERGEKKKRRRKEKKRSPILQEEQESGC